MNIFKAWKVWRKLNPIIQLIREESMSKSLFKSKTFWVNVLTAGVELSGVLTGVVGPGVLQIVTNVLNIALRLVTSQPVSVMPDSDAS